MIVIDSPAEPEVGERLFIFGTTVKETPLLLMPLTATITGPVVASEGTGSVMLLADQLVGVAVVPLKVTTLVPRLSPKFDPLMIIESPTTPDVAERLLIFGPTLNRTALLGWPATVITTGPVVAPEGTGTLIALALQLDGDALSPLNAIVLLP